MTEFALPAGSPTRITEPFASDADFDRSVNGYADAFVLLMVAAVVAVAVAMTVGGAWPVVPFVLPLPMLARASQTGIASSRRTKSQFADRRDWRDAERQAVAASFGAALVRRR